MVIHQIVFLIFSILFLLDILKLIMRLNYFINLRLIYIIIGFFIVSTICELIFMRLTIFNIIIFFGSLIILMVQTMFKKIDSIFLNFVCNQHLFELIGKFWETLLWLFSKFILNRFIEIISLILELEIHLLFCFKYKRLKLLFKLSFYGFCFLFDYLS